MVRYSVLAIALVLAALPVAAAGDDFCARVLVGTETVDPLRGGTEYSAREVEDLRFLVTFLEPVEGEHILELRLTTPAGHHYQTLTAPIATAGRGVARERSVPTYPRPLPVQVLSSVRTADGQVQTTEMRLPVAGTSITSGSLYGAWEVKLLLDGHPMGCEIRNFFVLSE